ncbi:ABC transporter substrate-binding protein/permease [Lacticaseibacillus thailandensis]|uniref:Glutamate ABC superfamily ATP binding cassette transporter, membrane protein n=1 Tax=Lacticaseibacillus thailandensis DSM 22698 = JCM 13996 TaxID=1423810 RepID=A0A0R2CER8_9LACO|nr:ABC transporter substrate-binding protein/permease [Lacticaseibacillus thailandensis]KRM86470.1 glutamate ABC superfamily ATP binding cassette transporter, membrane protein [Lacticaseibacillus thailandensis DSM 22698 = JCM 13996]
MKQNKFVWLLAALVACVVAWWVPQQEQSVHAAEQTYTIGTDTTFSPFAFTNKKNQSVGIDIDLLDAIAKKEGFKIQWKQLGFDGAVQALQAKQIDGVAAGMSITPERQKTFLFSHPYYKSGTYMAVKDQHIKDLKDLRGKKVAVKTGTTAADYANSMKKKYGFRVVTFDSDDNMYQDVLTGNTVACFEDKPVLQYAIANGIKLHLAKDFKEPDAGTYGFAFQKSEGALVKKVNAGLKALKANGQYAKIVAKYVGNGSQKSQARRTATQTESDRSFFGLLKANAGTLTSGLGKTMELTVVGIVCATVVGILMGLLGVLPNAFARGVANTFIYIFRGLPLMVLALFIYTGVPTLIGTKVPAFIAGIITLTLNEGAYTAAFVKGGIKAVDVGQMEAARSLGLTWGKTMKRVVLPQGIRIMIPSFINQFIITLKDTSILSVIGLLELTQTGKIIVARNMEGFKIWTMVALIYVIIITLLTWLSNWVQKKVHA